MNRSQLKTIFLLIIGLVLLQAISSYAQDDLEKALASTPAPRQKTMATFKATKLINANTNETIHRNELEFRVDHRFGDIAGDDGGIKNFFGLDNSTDVRIAFDYGITDRLSVGLSRSKGASSVQQLYEGSIKYRLLEQTTGNEIPLSVTFFGSNTVSATATNRDDPASATSYQNFAERSNWLSQLILSRKFSPNFSLLLIPTYLRRNLTTFRDQNDMFAIGAGGRLKFSKRMALVIDYFLPFRNRSDQAYIEQVNATKLFNPLGVGLEIETGGHVFHLNFTNATALQEMQFIPQTTSSWRKGQYRWGFSIARRFSLAPKDKS